MNEAVAAWLKDLDQQLPDHVELASYCAKQAKNVHVWNSREPAWARDAMLRLAHIAITCGACLQGCREAARELRQERDALAARLEQAHAAIRSAAHTAVVAIEHLQEISGLQKAAVAWVKGEGTQDQVFAEAEKLKKIVEARS